MAAILLEVADTLSMKLSDGFSRVIPSLLIFVFYALSFILFTFAIKKIDVSTAYAIWAGMGTVLIAGIGIVLFKEPTHWIKLISMALIIIGVVGLHLSDHGN